ncbi:predicted protein [Histoplasma capsulatum var. duboisii H88]|uniref:Predicted protein n=1 Tax=Ajellomyces capsulatus (strain H88) TaxID=544711 RepID=F0UMM4_AJEC8|nr:predicted protein [Histoplasma capsulatum var. duboisii H88]
MGDRSPEHERVGVNSIAGLHCIDRLGMEIIIQFWMRTWHFENHDDEKSRARDKMRIDLSGIVLLVMASDKCGLDNYMTCISPSSLLPLFIRRSGYGSTLLIMISATSSKTLYLASRSPTPFQQPYHGGFNFKNHYTQVGGVSLNIV